MSRQQRSLLRDTPFWGVVALMAGMHLAGTLIAVYGPDAWFWLSLRPMVLAFGVLALVIVGAGAIAYAVLRPLDPDRFLPRVPTHRSLDELPPLTDAERKAVARFETLTTLAGLCIAPVLIALGG